MMSSATPDAEWTPSHRSPDVPAETPTEATVTHLRDDPASALRRAEAAALRATLEREAAEARAEQLAAALEATRAELLEQAQARLVEAKAAPPPALAEPVVAEAPTEVEPPRPAAVEEPERIWPDGAERTVRFHSPHGSAVATLALGAGSLVAAGVAVWQAYLDQLTGTTGLVAIGATIVLVLALSRVRTPTRSVWLADGVLHVETDDAHRQFDLTTRATLVQMVGTPGQRRWKVLLLRKGQPAYEITRSLVDPTQLTAELKRWRPEL